MRRTAKLRSSTSAMYTPGVTPRLAFLAGVCAIALGAFVTGGVLAIGALAALVLWPSKSAESKQTVLVPTAGPGGAGAQLMGRF